MEVNQVFAPSIWGDMSPAAIWKNEISSNDIYLPLHDNYT